jgi:hypothetical protein
MSDCLPGTSTHMCLLWNCRRDVAAAPSITHPTTLCREGHGFGCLLANVMLDLFETARDLGAPQDFRRFNLCKEPRVPDRQQWEFECHNVNSFCLHAFAAFDGSANEKQRAEQCKVISRTICDLTEGVGTLTASHSMNQKACLGLLPAWCRDHAIIEPSSRVIQFFNTEYEMKKKLNKLELDRFFKTIARRLEVVFGGKFTQRVTENILCKAHRVLSNKGEAKWCDIISASQFLYKFAPGSVAVTHQLARKK